MILYPSLMISLVFAGGPAANPDKKKFRRSLEHKYFAITTFPNPSTKEHFCLYNEGAGRATLRSNSDGRYLCRKPNLLHARGLFTFEPASGSFAGQGRYTMKSLHDGLCVNFADAVQDLSLPMTDCASFGTTIPWFFQWNTTGKNPGSGDFSKPAYSVISSPFSNFTNSKNLASNGCYYSNSNGGINIKPCQDTQEMTWFAYMTEINPTDIVAPTAASRPCTRLYKNQKNDEYACNTFPGGYTIRAPFDAKNGQLARAIVDGNQYVHGISGGIIYNRIVSFTIHPEKSVSKVSDIAELGFMDNHQNLNMIYHVGLDADSTKIRFHNAWFGVTFTTSEQLPLKTTTKVKIIEIFEASPGSSSLFTAKFQIFFDRKTVLLENVGPKIGRILPPDLYFASPPKMNFDGTDKSVLPKAVVGPIKIKFNVR